ncbi:cytochrome P450 81E8-like [Neltuma alba]|uniref:cytochrome P450 81E8-like n=1 Tax=Neltuma alba TaxID=207710 RepID=UPI0010A4A861|nr:cytochrome P450 81E8-like [Prosopis alba]
MRNDIVLVNRPQFLTGKHVYYNYTTVSSAPYGEHWRNLRRILELDVLSTRRLNYFMDMLRDEMKLLVQKLAHDSRKGFTKVELRSRFSELTFNTMMRMISGKRYWGDDSKVEDVEEARKFRETMKELLMLGGANNPGDFLPTLRWFDLDNLEKKLKGISLRFDRFLQRIVDEHRSGNTSGNTLINHLLTLQKSEPEYYTYQIIKGPLLLPHMSSDKCTMGDYNIPPDTIVLINAWAIHRDPQLWSDPLCFNPERFQKEGEANKLMHFGLGRRACQGSGLAQRTMSWALGLLI